MKEESMQTNPSIPETPIPQEQIPDTQPASETTAEGPAEATIEAPAETPAEEAPEKKRKAPAALFAVIGTCVLLLVCVLLFVKKPTAGSGSSALEKASYLIGKVTPSGEGYVALLNGRTVEISDDVSYITATPDRKHILVITKNGELYITDPAQKEHTSVASNCKSVITVRNDGFFYTDKNDNNYRVLFSDLEPQKLGNDVVVAVADDNTTLLYATDSGDIYRLLNTEDVPTKVGYFPKSTRMIAISNDGQTGVWELVDGNDRSIVLLDGDDKSTLGSYSSEYSGGIVRFSSDQSLAVIGSVYGESLWIKTAGNEPVQAKLGAQLSTATIYTDSGLLRDAPGNKVSHLYVDTEADSGDNVYCISMDGDREKILSKTSEHAVSNNHIVYIDSDHNLYVAALEKGAAVKEEKLASDVSTLGLVPGKNYVYYFRSFESGEGTLYCYRFGQKEPVKVSSGVTQYTSYSPDGASVLFYKDVETISDTYDRTGMLMLWNYGDSEPKKVSSDVLTYSLDSGYDSILINPKSFLYSKYSSTDKDGKVLVNWMYWNGKDSVKVASDVIED